MKYKWTLNDLLFTFEASDGFSFLGNHGFNPRSAAEKTWRKLETRSSWILFKMNFQAKIPKMIPSLRWQSVRNGIAWSIVKLHHEHSWTIAFHLIPKSKNKVIFTSDTGQPTSSNHHLSRMGWSQNSSWPQKMSYFAGITQIHRHH